MNQYPPYVMRGTFVEPRSRPAIRRIAMDARKVLGLSDDYPPDLCRLLDEVSVKFALDYDVVEDSEMPIPGAEAVCIPEQAMIYLPQRSLARAAANEPRMRFTIFHEIGHFVLGHSRSYARSAGFEPKPFLDSEWQADQFAAEITMPLEVIVERQIFGANMIAATFGTSSEAARLRELTLRKEGVIQPTFRGGTMSLPQGKKESP